jgi:putative ABC transport system ATP-binding protein
MGTLRLDTSEPLVGLSDIRKTYRMGDVTLEVLHGITLAIDPGEYVAIMGPSGSGKSTLMHIMGCLDVPTSGTYTLAGQSLAGKSESELAPIRRRYVGFVFQSFNLLGALTALDNVALPLLYQGMPRRRQRELAEQALRRVGLEDRLHHRPSQLSGGQQQRVAIARAVVANPPFILADEPTGNLDSHSGAEILALFDELHREGRTLVVITHDAEVAAHADRIVHIRDGVIVDDKAVVR